MEKLGSTKYTMLGKGASAGNKPPKITANVLDAFRKAQNLGVNSFRIDGNNYTVSGLKSQLREIIAPADLARMSQGQKVQRFRLPTGGGRMDVIFANDGVLVSKKKRPSKANNKKKSRTGSTKYGCGLFK